MAKAKQQVINVDVFDVQVGVFPSDEARIEAMHAQGVPVEAVTGAAHASAHMDVSPEGVAWFGMVIKKKSTFASWAHECVHVADFIMENAGIPTDVSNTEVRAYLVGHLFQSLQEMRKARLI